MTTTADAITTLQFYPKRSAVRRYFALWYFTILLIVWNLLGHLFLGFEQSHLQPLVGLATAISLQFLLEWIDARASDRKLRFAGSWAEPYQLSAACHHPGPGCHDACVSQREADAGDIRRRRRHLLEGDFPRTCG